MIATAEISTQHRILDWATNPEFETGLKPTPKSPKQEEVWPNGFLREARRCVPNLQLFQGVQSCYRECVFVQLRGDFALSSQFPVDLLGWLKMSLRSCIRIPGCPHSPKLITFALLESNQFEIDTLKAAYVSHKMHGAFAAKPTNTTLPVQEIFCVFSNWISNLSSPNHCDTSIFWIRILAKFGQQSGNVNHTRSSPSYGTKIAEGRTSNETFLLSSCLVNCLPQGLFPLCLSSNLIRMTHHCSFPSGWKWPHNAANSKEEGFTLVLHGMFPLHGSFYGTAFGFSHNTGMFQKISQQFQKNRIGERVHHPEFEKKLKGSKYRVKKS